MLLTDATSLRIRSALGNCPTQSPRENDRLGPISLTIPIDTRKSTLVLTGRRALGA